jgi:chorismate mutase
VNQGDDPVVQELRERISALDRAILDAFNERLEVVAQLRRHKQERGYPLVDPEREASMLRALRAANRGPLSSEGVRELQEAIIGLGKREAGRSV